MTPLDVRERLKDLKTKADYLLVALSFIYYKNGGVAVFSLKAALTLTALVAVFPVQDYFESELALARIRGGKIACLVTALGFTLWWVWKRRGGFSSGAGALDGLSSATYSSRLTIMEAGLIAGKTGPGFKNGGQGAPGGVTLLLCGDHRHTTT